ncbi:MAG: HD-GYP domain-containing protein [Candidatus Omnitrophota bacterium]
MAEERKTRKQPDSVENVERRHQDCLVAMVEMDGVVCALSFLAEKKDPYTAGHQQRVAKLACAIAEEMGFSADQVKSIRVAGILHDIGKIYVPAEILAKPGKLNEAEFNIIKCHPQMGYDIVRVIKFPWPIAQFVLQHHERCNGSGYPQGLSDGQILLEAKILAVADVVEAMSSHRPYRPALGVDQALKEISKNQGLLYEPIVVDACLNLFQKKQFTFA